MCGIIGYCGHRPAVPVLVEGLRRLEYRGYDSAGVGFLHTDGLKVIKAKGKLCELDKKLAQENVFNATSGIGHTRWATHGEPNEPNAHPHVDHTGRLAMIHNGIIENYQEIKKELLAEGVTFKSETDTEVLLNLISKYLQEEGEMLPALSRALNRVEGAYAIAVFDAQNPGVVHAARVSSPLVLGVGTGENFLASDIPAFLPYTRDVVFLEDGELVRIDASSWQVMRVRDLSPVEKKVDTITWDVQAAQKGGHKHFMIKEIFEQPKVIQDCLCGRLATDLDEVRLPELDCLEGAPKRIHIVACGTSFHAGLWGMYLLEQWARIPVQVEIASEFRYRDPILDPDTLIIAISQSGETADTLAGIKLAKQQGLKVLGLCNVVGSSVARESDYVVYTQAGPEISVASTKAMCSQLTALLLLTLHWGSKTGKLDPKIHRDTLHGLRSLPELLEKTLPALRDRAFELAREYSDADSFLYLGRGLYYPLALEGALKLKEISYIHAEGYAAGEMKHGPIALIDPKFPSFAIALDDDLFPKVKSNLVEVQARSGEIIALTNVGLDLEVDHRWDVPRASGPLATFLALPALQLFAYEVADYLGKDVDQPRNLAKSVTVE
ncbi:glutamine--fructose-6-phosphate transaminase (isomerizing) [Paucidesulfovibrio longus]|uniref:glutamine--fructose-6-phosphate transaminase (isomerizing) n=1 Tax=Paucidesulfovibrio longus TaxID=889 RepID=UPI0003B51FD6|nr:glutamine--fructose-6-phosphate transaminase (isomerizing) [Paucidesulfovibrio longus]